MLFNWLVTLTSKSLANVDRNFESWNDFHHWFSQNFNPVSFGEWRIAYFPCFLGGGATGFSLPGGGGGGGVGGVGGGGGSSSQHWLKIYSSLPNQEKFLLYNSPTKQQFSCYNPTKTSVLAAVIAPVPFLSYLHTVCTQSLFNFDFNQCSIFTECCF